MVNIVRKGEIAFTRNLSFFHNVFHSYISLVRQNAALCGNGLIIRRAVLLSQESSLNAQDSDYLLSQCKRQTTC